MDGPFGQVGYADAARLRQRLNAGRDIDAVTINAFRRRRGLAEIDADAKGDRLVVVVPNHLVLQFTLKLSGKADRLRGAVEEGKNAVAGDIDNPAAIIADKIAKQPDRPGDTVDVVALVPLHEATEAGNVGDHDRRQPAGYRGQLRRLHRQRRTPPQAARPSARRPQASLPWGRCNFSIAQFIRLTRDISMSDRYAK